ncbi:hypothetical protein SLA2020_446900 [Shorea laevis]
MVVIYGIGGIGKTTIAKAVYNSIADQFQGSYFLENVRETSKQLNGLVRLLEGLLSNILGDLKVGSFDELINLIHQSLSSKRVLLVLDDVDQFFHIDDLGGELCSLGFESRIIITIRDTRLLAEYDYKSYKVELLNHNEAF